MIGGFCAFSLLSAAEGVRRGWGFLGGGRRGLGRGGGGGGEGCWLIGQLKFKCRFKQV